MTDQQLLTIWFALRLRSTDPEAVDRFIKHGADYAVKGAIEETRAALGLANALTLQERKL
jgi:hypothetical protein